MRIYPYKGAPRAVFDHPEWGHFEADEEGGFDLPDELSDELSTFHHRGQKLWETEDERSTRRHASDLERRRDPAALHDAVSDMVTMFRQVTAGISAGQPASPEAVQEIAELRRQLTELQAATTIPETAPAADAEPDPEPDDETPAGSPASAAPAAKPGRRRTAAPVG